MNDSRAKLAPKAGAPSIDETVAALRTFIRSGSANGDEAMRKHCLKVVATMPDCIAALQAIRDEYDENGKIICDAFGIESLDDWPKMQMIRAALAKAGVTE